MAATSVFFVFFLSRRACIHACERTASKRGTSWHALTSAVGCVATARIIFDLDKTGRRRWQHPDETDKLAEDYV